jgi:hypothetical protein
MTVTRRLLAPSPGRLVALLEAPPETPRQRLDPRLEAALVARLAGTRPRAHRGARRLDAFAVEHGAARFATPFRWSARAARRVLGTAALGRLVRGAARDLRGAVDDELDAQCDRARRGLARRGALGTWLAAATDQARALSAADAVGWATALWHLVDGDAHGAGLDLGVPDAWFTVPAGAVTLHGRRDAVAGSSGALLRVRDGAPSARALDGLGVDALAAALADPRRAVPSRIVGAWPDGGTCLAVELDDDVLRDAARAVVACDASWEVARDHADVAAIAA